MYWTLLPPPPPLIYYRLNAPKKAYLQYLCLYMLQKYIVRLFHILIKIIPNFDSLNFILYANLFCFCYHTYESLLLSSPLSQ